MKKISFLATLTFVAQLAIAQIKLPQASPGATVIQTVGTTDFTITYSRPSLKGRTALGNQTPLAPFGQLWRTGANAATNFITTTDVLVQGQKLPAGSYSVFTIPNQGEWTLILNKNLTASAEEGIPNGYKKEEDALRVQIKSEKVTKPYETFSIGFSDLTDSTANLNIYWADTRATASLKVDVIANAQANVEKAVADKPEDAGVLQTAANWNLSKGYKLDQALAWVDKSIGLKENYTNVWIKAQILSKMGKVSEALPLAQKALALGEASNDPAFRFYKDGIQKGVSDYQALMPVATKAIKVKKKKA
jgi:tetratricopeptide (TPR) repeat protein